MATWTSFDKFILRQLDGNAIDFDTDTFKIALVSTDCSAARATADFFDDLVEAAPQGGNYTAGGIAATVTLNLATNHYQIKSTTAITWAQNAGNPTNALYAVLYKSTGVASTSALIAYLTLGGTRDLSTSDLTITTTSDLYATI